MITCDEHRPVLCGLRNRWTRPVGNALWVSTHGSPMTSIAIYDVFTRRTAEAFGQPINPHLFRDCAATSIAIDDPEHVRIASQILGHRSTATTEHYYNQAQAIDAARRYQDFLVALRNGTMTEQTRTHGDADARRHLRPLFDRPAARRLDRGPGAALPRPHRGGRLVAGRDLHRSCDQRRQPAAAGLSEAAGGRARRRLRCRRGRGARPAVARPGGHRRPLQAAGLRRRAVC